LFLGDTEIADTTVGRATGTSQIVGHTLILTTGTNSVLTVRNTHSGSALTVTPHAGAGDDHAVSGTLLIKRIV